MTRPPAPRGLSFELACQVFDEDTNVILDVVSGDPQWLGWSLRQLEIASVHGKLLINDVIYAEASFRYRTIEAMESVLRDASLVPVQLPRAALFLAAKVHQSYRARGGARTGVLPDFVIGAHAVVGRMPLVTRDVGRYATYFPTIRLITPQCTAS